jgi:hypothetical protein
MPTLSNSTFSVVLDTGNRAVYSVQPQHVNERPGTTLAERARFYGEQLAVEIGGQWYKTGAKELITDLRLVALLERVPSADY